MQMQISSVVLGIQSAGSAAILVAMAAVRLYCSLLLLTNTLPTANNLCLELLQCAWLWYTCLQGNQAEHQLITWVHTLVPTL